MIVPAIDTTMLFIGKAFALLAIGIYAVFALVVVKQVYMMIETLNAGFSFVIKIIAWGHVIAVIFVFLIALTIL